MGGRIRRWLIPETPRRKAWQAAAYLAVIVLALSAAGIKYATTSYPAHAPSVTTTPGGSKGQGGKTPVPPQLRARVPVSPVSGPSEVLRSGHGRSPAGAGDRHPHPGSGPAVTPVPAPAVSTPVTTAPAPPSSSPAPSPPEPPAPSSAPPETPSAPAIVSSSPTPEVIPSSTAPGGLRLSREPLPAAVTDGAGSPAIPRSPA